MNMNLISQLLDLDLEWTLYLYKGAFLPNWAYLPLTIVGSVWFFFCFYLAKIFHEWSKKKTFSWQTLQPFLCLLIFMALTEALKITVGRLRPDFFFENPHQAFVPFCLREAYHSFPSSHAAVLTFIGRYRQKPIWYLLALMSGLSRVLIKRHFLLDVCFGLVWGWLLGMILLSFSQNISASPLLEVSKEKLTKLASRFLKKKAF
jgi:membrane-associated phospholipid phosphatase